MDKVPSSDVVVQAPAPTMRVLSLSRVAPSRQHGQRVKLSFLDVLWVCLPPVQQLFLYDLGDRDDAFPAVVSRLKAALAHTLTHFLPLAGKLEYEAETGDLVVDCSDASVAFVEADAVDADIRRLAYDEVEDMRAFVRLVPELDARVLPAPVLSVQVTRLGASGLAIGLSMHHAVADGRALWRFMEAWASASREGSPVTKALGPPLYSRDCVHYPGADQLAREWLKINTPSLPVVSSSERDLTSERLSLARAAFHLGVDDIRSIKRWIDDHAAAAKPKPVSTFVALAALAWTAFVRSKGLGAGDDTYLMFFADLRARLDPPVADAFLGNCATAFVARCADAAEIAGEAGILHAARAVQEAMAQMDAAPLPAAGEGWPDKLRDVPFARLVNVVGSPWFQGYKAADFGFGKPALSEVVSMNHDGEMMLIGGRREGEGLASMRIDPAHMPTFKACILGG